MLKFFDMCLWSGGPAKNDDIHGGRQIEKKPFWEQRIKNGMS